MTLFTPPSVVLRPYQELGINQISSSFQSGNKRVILCMATGSGKSKTAMRIVQRTLERKKRVLFLCDRNLLVDQFAAEAREWNLDHGVIRKGGFDNRLANFVIASKDTFASIYLRRKRFEPPPYDLIIPDECHRGSAPTWQKVFELYPSAYRVGLTATPIRPTGASLGPEYQDIVCPIKPSELRQQGYLVSAKCFSPSFPDLRGVRRGADGDYNRSDLEKVMNRKNMVGDVVGWWKRLAVDRPTITYGVSIKHSIALRDNYLKEGIKAVHIDGKSSDEELIDAFNAFREQRIKILCCADLLTEGIDLPLCSCIQIVRPTKSLRLALQMYGRAMRPHDATEKIDMLVIDHAGVVLYNGLPGQDIPWTVNPEDGNVQERLKKEQEEGKLPTPIICTECFFMYQGLPACPQCGHKPEKRGKDIAMRAGTLVEVDSAAAPKPGINYDKIWGRCLATAANSGRTFGTAAAIFKSQTGKTPWEAMGEAFRGMPPRLPDERQTDPKRVLYNWKAFVIDTYPEFRRKQFA